MSSTTKARQNKLVKVGIAPETTVGTYVTYDANTKLIPIVNTAAPDHSRGTRLISRATTLDGFAGGMEGVIGSMAWTYTAEAELHAQPQGENEPYFLYMLCASGHETVGTTSGSSDIITFTPSTAEISAFSTSSNDHEPCSVSLTFVRNHDQVEDTAIRIRGATGATTFSLTANETAKISTTFVGLIENDELLDSSDVDISALGTFPTTKPFVVKAINLTLTDPSTGAQSVYGLQNFDFTTGFETPDFIDPTETWGFGVSPPILNVEPTVSFSVMNTNPIDEYFATKLLAGTKFAIEVTLNSEAGADACTLEFDLPQLQFDSVTEADVGGLAGYSINARVVRTPGQEALYSIIYTYLT